MNCKWPASCACITIILGSHSNNVTIICMSSDKMPSVSLSSPGIAELHTLLQKPRLVLHTSC